VYRVLEAT